MVQQLMQDDALEPLAFSIPDVEEEVRKLHRSGTYLSLPVKQSVPNM
jgi:hypothetical protein